MGVPPFLPIKLLGFSKLTGLDWQKRGRAIRSYGATGYTVQHGRPLSSLTPLSLRHSLLHKHSLTRPIPLLSLTLFHE